MKLLNEDEEYITSLLKQGKKVEAIAFIKNKTGMTLKEAKDYIDKKNIAISEEDEQYLSSLINENKELEAVTFLHKNKDMSLFSFANVRKLFYICNEKQRKKYFLYNGDNR